MRLTEVLNHLEDVNNDTSVVEVTLNREHFEILYRAGEVLEGLIFDSPEITAEAVKERVIGCKPYLESEYETPDL